MFDFRKYITSVPDFPSVGIDFKDITPLLANAKAMQHATDALFEMVKNEGITKVVGIESRGFIFAPLLAARLGVGFVPIRKPNKLPRKTVSQSYALEYGKDTLHMHADAIVKGDRVLLHDDVLATGGTAAAACGLIRQLGGDVVQCNFIIGLSFLNGAEKLSGVPIQTLVTY